MVATDLLSIVKCRRHMCEDPIVITVLTHVFHIRKNFLPLLDGRLQEVKHAVGHIRVTDDAVRLP